MIKWTQERFSHKENIFVRFRPLLVDAFFAMASVFDLSACADSPPAIGSHLPGTFAVASDAFDQRVKARFPVGSGEAALRTELEREGFVTTRDKDSPLNFSARFHANELACVADWAVRWSGEEGKIANIEARYKEVVSRILMGPNIDSSCSVDPASVSWMHE